MLLACRFCGTVGDQPYGHDVVESTRRTVRSRNDRSGLDRPLRTYGRNACSGMLWQLTQLDD